MIAPRHIAPLALALFGLVLSAAPTTAQIPEEFTNLQVLSQDIDRRELIGIMRGFATDLGVRCNFCHVGEDPDSLEGYDFAADEKGHKKIARVMIEMTRDINSTHLPKMGKESPRQVTCVTCHHGQKEPSTLTAELMAAYDDGGGEAMVARYHSLRDELYGQGAFNFGEMALLGVATEMARGRQDMAAAAAYEKALAIQPDNPQVRQMLERVKQ